MQLMEAMEASTSTGSGNFHVLIWKLLLTSIEVNLLSPASMEISMEVNLLPSTSMEAPMEVIDFHGCQLISMEVSIEVSMEVSMEAGGNLHGSRSNGSRWILVEVLWKQLEVCDTRGSR